MLEEPLATLNDLLCNLEEISQGKIEEYDEREKFCNKAIEVFKLAAQNTRDPEVKLIVANMPKLLCEDLVAIAQINLLRSLLTMVLLNLKYSLEVINREMPQISKSEDAERIKLLEEETETLRSQMELMKPLFARLKEDYEKRKKWLKENK